MKQFDYKISDIEQIYEAPAGFFEVPVCIIDNEISNDISADWDYEKAKIICVGFLAGNSIKIFVAEKDGDEDFKNVVIEELERMKLDFEFFAFNRFMEMGNFRGDFGYETKIAEIKPFNAKGWNKDAFYKKLLEKKIIPTIKISDPFNGDSRLCIDRWQKYLKDKKQQHLMDIVSHNMNCLLKECIIYKNKKWFEKNYLIDHKGWLKGEK